MIGVADGLYELKMDSSILTRRGGTDANAPESPRKAVLRDWHVGISAPQMLEKSGESGKNNSNKYEMHFYKTMIGRNEQRMHRSG